VSTPLQAAKLAEKEAKKAKAAAKAAAAAAASVNTGGSEKKAKAKAEAEAKKVGGLWRAGVGPGCKGSHMDTWGRGGGK
jgi:hypothetical protein